MPETTKRKKKVSEPFMVAHTCGHCGAIRHVRTGASLRALRESSGVSLRALARANGLSAATLSNVETGKMPATPRVEAAYTARVPHVG